ncbi:MAG: DUF6147 family protein [Lachnospiraceae bacterium]|nr:DUF6147 family protein [Lachnospiraceae bacterium]
MNRKKKKRFLSLLLAMTVLGTMMYSAVPVSAQGKADVGKIVNGSELILSDEAEDSSQSLSRGVYLASGTVKLSNDGNSSVLMFGMTSCNKVSEKVYLNVYLEQLDDETQSWYTYKYWNFNTVNDYSLTKTLRYTVPSGHWYRMRGAHVAITGSIVESTTTTTDGIWI